MSRRTRGDGPPAAAVAGGPLRWLTQLIAALRSEGIAVSPAEAIDAARALAVLDFERRAEVHAALRLTLAKSRLAAEVLDRRFAALFRPPRRPRAGERGEGGKGGEGQQGGAGARGAGGRRSGAGQPHLAGKVPRGAQARGEPLPAESPRGQAGAGGSPEPAPGQAARIEPAPAPRRRPAFETYAPAYWLGAASGLSGLPAARVHRAPAALPAPARHPGERRRRAQLEQAGEQAFAGGRRGPRQRRLRAAARRVRPPAAPSAGHDPRRYELSGALAPEHARRLARALARALVRLRRARARRRRAARRRGELWVHRALRVNLGAEGVPFVLPRRRRCRRPPRLFVLADVSHSVARAAGVFLHLVAALAAELPEVRAHLFVDRPVEVPPALLRRYRAGATAEALAHGFEPEQLVAALAELRPGARSDYGKALYAYLEAVGRRLGRHAAVLIYGDARTNWFAPEAWCLEELAARAGALVWLVPEPRARWGTGDSALLEYAPHCDAVYEAATVEGMEAALHDLLAWG
ncbi:MAG: hypothetical protein KatS3mg102_2831 [Planctomycetota bacterium]|nr:MAG: hypothetical protein KatS3mg102_2831 [Planctomycetota bacterium]